MDGKTIFRAFESQFGDQIDGNYFDTKMVWDSLYEAAKKITSSLRLFTSTQTITTVASTRTYDLNPDFMGLAWRNDDNEEFIKYNNGTSNTFLYPTSYDALILADQSTAVSIPDSFAIKEKASATQITGTTTSLGAVTANTGECTLNNSSATFVTNGISVGDYIYNRADNSEGVVLAVTSAIALVTALFHGTDNDWTSGDFYYITPQHRYQLHFDPPPSTAGHTVTIYYIQRPYPVYSPLRFYGFSPDYKQALIAYACWLYKYADREPNYGDAFYKMWNATVMSLATDSSNIMSKNNKGYRVQMKKSARRSGSYR